MIGSIKHKGLKRLYEDDDPKGIRPDMVERVRILMAQLDVTQEIEELAALPSLRLHALKGNLKGYWAITVRANWRIIFKFEDGIASAVELTDYH